MNFFSKIFKQNAADKESGDANMPDMPANVVPAEQNRSMSHDYTGTNAAGKMNYKLMFYEGYDYHFKGECYLGGAYALKNFRPGKYDDACFEYLEDAIKEVKLILKDECFSSLKYYMNYYGDIMKSINGLFENWRYDDIPVIINMNDDVPESKFSVNDYVKELQNYLLQKEPQTEDEIKTLIEKFRTLTVNEDKTPLPVEMQIKIRTGRLSKYELINIRENFQLDAEQLNLLGNAFRQIVEYGLAEKAYLTALELSPEYENPYANLLSLYILQEKYGLCEEIYLKGMRLSSGRQSVIVYQDGRLHYIKGDYNMAFKAAQSCLTVEKFQDEPSFELAVKALLALVKQGKDTEKNHERARELWKMGINIFPDSERMKELSKYFTNDE
jgi:tetratricopeptide (TPR) repeat protein